MERRWQASIVGKKSNEIVNTMGRDENNEYGQTINAIDKAYNNGEINFLKAVRRGLREKRKLCIVENKKLLTEHCSKCAEAPKKYKIFGREIQFTGISRCNTDNCSILKKKARENICKKLFLGRHNEYTENIINALDEFGILSPEYYDAFEKAVDAEHQRLMEENNTSKSTVQNETNNVI